MTTQSITQEVNKKVLCITMAVSCVFLVLRTVARYVKTKKVPYEAEDIAMYVALCAFIIQCSLYLAAMPTLYNALEIQAGKMAPYPSLVTDLPAMLKEFLSVLIFFWLTLWAVKASLLFMFRKLTIGLPFYQRIWAFVMAFCALTFIGCVISDFTSCSNMDAWFNAGACFKPRDAKAKSISLWYALGVDLLTDVMIMAVPTRLLWNLRVSMREKIGLAFIFTVGIITMIFAIVRSVSLEGTNSGGQVSTQWLILWGAIEGMVAIIVGCLPSFAIFIRSQVEATRTRRNSVTFPAPLSTTIDAREFTSQTKSSGFDSFQSERTKPRTPIDSLHLDDIELVDSSMDGDSRQSLFHDPVNEAGEPRYNRDWNQRWLGGVVEQHPETSGAANKESDPNFI